MKRKSFWTTEDILNITLIVLSVCVVAIIMFMALNASGDYMIKHSEEYQENLQLQEMEDYQRSPKITRKI